MARWFIVDVRWEADVPPLPRNLAVANRRIRREDSYAPELTERGFVDPSTGGPARWRFPLLGAADVFRILRDSNCRPLCVSFHECRCWDWSACDRRETECPDPEWRGRLVWEWRRSASVHADRRDVDPGGDRPATLRGKRSFQKRDGACPRPRRHRRRRHG